MYFAITTTGVLVSSLQDPIGASVSNHRIKGVRRLQWSQLHRPGSSRVTTVLMYTAGRKRQKMAKISLFNRKRGDNLSFQPNRPGGKCFWVTGNTFCRKKFAQTRLFFLCAVHFAVHSKTIFQINNLQNSSNFLKYELLLLILVDFWNVENFTSLFNDLCDSCASSIIHDIFARASLTASEILTGVWLRCCDF